jgi:IS30 family transposase
MKDIKTLLLLVVSILLIVVSVFLLWTWTYRVKSITATVEKKDSVMPTSANVASNEASNAAITDSLQRFYNSVLGNINRSIDSVRNSTDSLKGLGTKLAEFYKLRTEISDLLKTKLSDADIAVAKQKIMELQLRVTQLRIANTDVEQENKRLTSLVAQLSSYQKTVATQNQPVADNRPVAQRTAFVASDISASDIKLNAVMETDDNNEQETVWAQQTSKFVGSFTVKNNTPQTNMIEMVVVVLQPDGKVLQKSTWETGTFDTKEGKKIYSYKLRADYNAGEAKRFQFSLSNDRYQKGNYTMQVYNKGVLIARVVKSLS